MAGCWATSDENTSPTVAPSASTLASPPVFLRRTVGMRTVAIGWVLVSGAAREGRAAGGPEGTERAPSPSGA
jgi:hypothetical protein